MAISTLNSELTAELCALLHRACRAVRFYPSQHSLAREAVETLARAFSDRLDYYPMLQLTVQEDCLLEDAEVVYQHVDLRDSLAFQLFRDGIREICFHPGLGRQEIEAFVLTLAQAQGNAGLETDLAGALWEQDFAHLSYTLVDPLLESEGEGHGYSALLDRLDGTLAQLPLTLEGAFTPHLEPRTLLEAHLPQESRARGAVLSGSLLSQEDLAAMEQLVASDEDDEVLDDFALVLAEVITSARSATEVRAAARALNDLLTSFLQWGEIARLSDCVERLFELTRDQQARTPDMEGLLRSLVQGEGIRQLILSVDSPQGPSSDQVERLLVLLAPHSYAVMVECLLSSTGKASRKCLLNSLVAAGRVPLALLTPHLADSRWFVVRNMVYLLGRLKDPAAQEHLTRALRHPDERVRREAVRSLAAAGDEKAAVLVLSCLDDPASSVRAAAARHAPSLAGIDVTSALLRQVSARDFPSRPFSEAQSLLDALGRLADDRAVPALEKLWRSRGLFRARPLTLRLEALRTLGDIGTPAARASLTLAAGSSEKPISEQAGKTLIARIRWTS